MNERQIDQNEAVEILGYWQREARPVEVVIRFGQGLIQAHPGRVTVEPEGQLVVADIAGKDHYFSTIVDMFAFDKINLSESGNVITLEEPYSAIETFRSVTIACRER